MKVKLHETIKFNPSCITYFINPELEIINLQGQEHMIWCEENTQAGKDGLKGLPLLFKITNDGWVRIHIELNQFACYSGVPSALFRAREEIIMLLMKHKECTQATIEYPEFYQQYSISNPEDYDTVYKGLKKLR